MSRRRTVIIAVVALLVLGGAVALLAFLPQSEDSGEQPSPTPTAAITASLTDELVEDVSSVDFTPAEGAKFSIIQNHSDGTFNLTADCELLFNMNQNELKNTFESAIAQRNLKLILENADDGQIALFGMDKPFMTIRVNRLDGTYDELEIGVESTVDASRYVRKKGERDIYLATYYGSTQLVKNVEAYYSYAFLPSSIPPATEEDTTYFAFATVTLEQPDKILEVARNVEQDSDFRLTRPFEVGTNPYTLATEFLVPITNIAPSEVVEVHPQDLSKYGLDVPARLSLKDVNGWSGVLLIGNYDSALGGRYVMIEGKDAVLLDMADAYMFLDATVSRLRSGLAWVYDIVTVSSIDFMLEDKTRRIEYKHYADGTLTAMLDGVELTELNGRRLYSSMLSVSVNGDADVETPTGAPDYKFTITFTDGTKSALELFEINDRQYLLVLNGENLKTFTYKATLRDKLLNKLDKLDNGEDLPLM